MDQPDQAGHRLTSEAVAVHPRSRPYSSGGAGRWQHGRMDTFEGEAVSALAINVVIPTGLRWRDTRRGDEYELQTITVRLLPDGGLAAKAYGRPVAGGRGGYVSFAVPDRPELRELICRAADTAAKRWGAHRGLGD